MESFLGVRCKPDKFITKPGEGVIIFLWVIFADDQLQRRVFEQFWMIYIRRLNDGGIHIHIDQITRFRRTIHRFSGGVGAAQALNKFIHLIFSKGLWGIVLTNLAIIPQINRWFERNDKG